MMQKDGVEEADGAAARKGRGPTRPHPANTLEEALKLVRSIVNDGIDGKIVRLTLAKMLERSHEYRLTRDLITSSSKYGLIKGSYAARELAVTDQGNDALVSLDSPSKQSAIDLFDIGISGIEPFQKLFQKLKERALPDGSVLSDELRSLGVAAKDSPRAAAVFVDNLRFLNLVVEVGGREHVSSVESISNEVDGFGGHQSEELHETDADEGISPSLNGTSGADSVPSPVVPGPAIRQATQVGPATSEPTVHIDIQIHIDSSATAELIDGMFASMAKHIYGREG